MLYYLERQHEIARLAGHEGFINNLVFFSNEQVLASGGDDKIIRLWDVASHQGLGELRGHENKITDIVCLKDDKTLVSSSSDMTVRIWRDGEEVRRIPTEYRVVDLDVSPDRELLAGVSLAGFLHLWKLPSMEPVGQFRVHEQGRAVTFSLDGGLLVTSGFKDKTATVWEAATWQPRFRLPIQPGRVNVAWFDSEGLLYIGTKQVDVWNIARRTLLGTLPNPDDEPNIFSWASAQNGKLLLIGQGGRVRVFSKELPGSEPEKVSKDADGSPEEGT